jgi:hypothetical protein
MVLWRRRAPPRLGPPAEEVAYILRGQSSARSKEATSVARKEDRATGSASNPTDAANDAADASLKRVLAGQDAIREWQEDVYRQFHQHPELSNQEVHTAATAADTLHKAGYEVHDQVGTTGVVGILRNGDGPTVLMRADMDALPMKEETGLPYASTDRQTDSAGQVVPVAHSCGHDVHVASLMGAARLLAENRSAWHGTFIPLFQPAEEVGTGAEKMVKGGLARLIPKPDVALAQHVLAYPSGTVGTLAGPFCRESRPGCEPAHTASAGGSWITHPRPPALHRWTFCQLLRVGIGWVTARPRAARRVCACCGSRAG